MPESNIISLGNELYDVTINSFKLSCLGVEESIILDD
jgi:hypothetical protein